MEIKAKKLTKQYGKDFALNNFDLELSGNKIIGLLGKNGAGKTTFMRMLSGHFLQTSGTIKIDDQSPFNNYPITKNICFIQESNNFHEKFRVQEVLDIASIYYPNWDKNKAKELTNIFKLKEKQKVKALSKGMSSALGIIIGLSSNAPLTIFDEPYIGLDASFRSTFYDLLLESYENNPRMFILSTHLIDEVSKLFEEVVILHEGNKMLHESSEHLAEKHMILTGNKEIIDPLIEGKNVIHEKSILGQKSVVLFDEVMENIPTDVAVSKATLQDLFVYLTKEEVKR